MQQTTKYKFSLIDRNDAFSPDELNKNAEAVERELARVETETAAALASRKSEAAAGDAAVRAEFAAADAKLSQAITAVDTKLSQTITAVEQGAKLFHLAGPVINNNPTGTPYTTVDLSGIDMTQYKALVCFTYSTFLAKITFGGLSGSNFGNSIGVIFNAGGYDVMVGINAGSSACSAETQWNTVKELQCNRMAYIDVYGIKK